jgi:hypothetical protein
MLHNAVARDNVIATLVQALEVSENRANSQLWTLYCFLFAQSVDKQQAQDVVNQAFHFVPSSFLLWKL